LLRVARFERFSRYGVFGLRSNAALPLFDDAVQSAQQTAVFFLRLRAFAPLRENFFNGGHDPEFICQSATGDIP
jgi:hypothetical protein